MVGRHERRPAAVVAENLGRQDPMIRPYRIDRPFTDELTEPKVFGLGLGKHEMVPFVFSRRTPVSRTGRRRIDIANKKSFLSSMLAIGRAEIAVPALAWPTRRPAHKTLP